MLCEVKAFSLKAALAGNKSLVPEGFLLPRGSGKTPLECFDRGAFKPKAGAHWHSLDRIANRTIIDMMLTERATKILEAAVRDFIDVGEPISSGWLYDHYDFGIKPAMIRLELERLSEDGFLEQPYFSAGRVPSDRGFEFFAERIFSSQWGSGGLIQRSLGGLLRKKAWPDLVERMSSELGLLSVAEDIEKERLYKEGLDSLVNSLSWTTAEEIKSVVKDFVELDKKFERFAELFGETGGEPKVFIGKKSPITKSGSLAVVAGSYEVHGGRVFLAAIGSKRMDYKKTAGVFKSLKNAGRK